MPNDQWATPWPLFNQLDAEFGFTLDPCASATNAKCARYFTEADNGLARSWEGERCFVNPPYSNIAPWVEKAWHEAQRGATVVLLIPPRTELAYWHDWILGDGSWLKACADEVRFVRGRVCFVDPSGQRNSPRDPSVLVVYYSINAIRPLYGRRPLVSSFVQAKARELVGVGG